MQELTASMKELQSELPVCYCIADFDVQDRVWQRVFENYRKHRSANKALLFGIRQVEQQMPYRHAGAVAAMGGSAAFDASYGANFPFPC